MNHKKALLLAFLVTTCTLSHTKLKIISDIEKYKKLPTEEQLVDIAKVNPNIILDIKYATKDNFVGKKMYAKHKGLIRLSVAKKLDKVQKELEKLDLGLKIWDPYRPYKYQQVLYDSAQDKKYVADPKKGSLHNRGAAVDLTIVDKNGKELEMPTPFDWLSHEAHLDFMDLPAQTIVNRKFLGNLMVKHGFTLLQKEWWHFNDAEYLKYDLLDIDFVDLEKLGL